MDQNQIMLLLGVLLALSEMLGSFEYFKSNSVFQLVVNVIKSVAGKKE